MRTASAALFALLWLSPHPATAQRAQELARLGSPPIIDGTLKDPAWRRATVFRDFKTLHPVAGKQPLVRTALYLGYDRSKIYVGIRGLDQDSAQSGDEAADDWVAFCLDSRGDGIGAFYFRVTSGGARRAGVLDGDGNPTATREMQWTSAAKRSARGYTVTMAIPLAQFAFASGDSVVMAFKAARFVSRSREESDFPDIVPGRAHVAQLRRIVLSGIEPSRTSDDGFVTDLREAYRMKVRRSAQLDYGTLEGRVRGWQDASVMDYLVFPSRALHASSTPFFFQASPRSDSVTSRFERLDYLPGRPIRDMDGFLTRTQTQSFIVIRNDTILCEKYFNGYSRDSMMTSFSIAKSFASTLVGIAIDRGLIHGVADPITAYLPELEKRDPLFRRITIRDLLHMSSGLRYVEDGPPHDNDITYLDPDLRAAALQQTSIVGRPGDHWHYNNYNPLLIGMILERVTGKTVTELLQAQLWEPLGMEFDGSWSIDSRKHGFEKMESGINARAIDFAKLGALFLHHGRWRGTQIVSAAWVEQATQPAQDPPGFYEDQGFFGAGGHYYGLFWWGSRRSAGESDYYGVGNKGEYVYCSPQKHLIIVRTGMQFGIPSSAWVRLFRQLADQF